ncbi:MAG: metallophosphoesterase [Methylacidiphilales bacterium]|nr:metallophosphoesterase [Candidatus Methylacidiphilales bacterium]
MPIHLPPLTRRAFLRTSIFAGTALALGDRRLSAAETAPDPHTWALLSDVHINADPLKEDRGVVMTENLKAVVKEILALSKRPAHMFIDGDCAHHSGELADYTQFLSLIEPARKSGMPIDLTLGNHDHREHFISSIPGAGKHPHPVENRYVSVLQTARANWFMLDSLDQVNMSPGLFGRAQLDWLAKQLDANKDKPAIICGHHTLYGKGSLQDTDAFLALLAPRRQVKAYIFGHSHAWAFAEHEGIHLINLPAVAYVFSKEQPNGWVHATLLESGLRLQLSALDKTHPAHGQVKEFAWRS